MTPMSDPSALAIVIDDPIAPRVLAWWDARKPGRPGLRVVGAREELGSAFEDLSVAQRNELCRVAFAPVEQVRATLERCELAGLLSSNDGGVAQVAKRWLATHVAQQLTPARRGKPKTRERGGAILLAVACIAAGFVVALAALSGEHAHGKKNERPAPGMHYQGGA